MQRRPDRSHPASHAESQGIKYVLSIRCFPAPLCSALRPVGDNWSDSTFLRNNLFHIFRTHFPRSGEIGPFGELQQEIALLANIAYVICTAAAIYLIALAVIGYLLQTDTMRIGTMIRQALYQPSHGNPLHLRDGDLLPKVSCWCISSGLYGLTISAQQSVSVDVLIAAAPTISAALNRKYQQYAVVQVDADIAFRSVTFIIEDVLADRSITFTSAGAMLPESPHDSPRRSDHMYRPDNIGVDLGRGQNAQR